MGIYLLFLCVCINILTKLDCICIYAQTHKYIHTLWGTLDFLMLFLKSFCLLISICRIWILVENILQNIPWNRCTIIYLPIFLVFLMFKLILEKAEEPEINCQHPLDHGKSKRVAEKHLFLLYWLCQSLWLCGSQ